MMQPGPGQAAPMPGAGGPPVDPMQMLMQPVSPVNPAIMPLMQMVGGVQQQDRQQLQMGQNMFLQMIVQQLSANDMDPSAGFAEGATGSAPLAEEAPAPGMMG